MAFGFGLGLPRGGSAGGFSPLSLFSAGEPGAWYDPSDWNASTFGWRRNLLTWTEQFNNAAWTKFSTICTPDTTVAPDGNTTADTITDTVATGSFAVVITLTVVGGGVYTWSIYAKAGTKSWLMINAQDSASNRTYFNLSNGTVGTNAVGSTATMTAVGSGWYRCTVSRAVIGASCLANYQMTTGDGVTSYTGDGTGTLILWGAQLEVGSTATSYQMLTDVSTQFIAAFPQYSMFQDSAGVTAAYAVEQPVALLLDKSKGATAGSELVDTANTAAAWAQVVGTPTIANSAPGVQVTTTGAGDIAQCTLNAAGGVTVDLTVGAVYLITGSISISTGSVGLSFTNATTSPASGTFSSTTLVSFAFRIIPANTGIALRLGSMTTGAVCQIQGISVKLIAGSHAIQQTAGNRPTLRARYNLLTQSQDFTNVAWPKTLATVTANATTAPDGTLTAGSLNEDATAASAHNVFANIAKTATATQYTFSVYVKASGRNWVEIALYDNVSAGTRWWFNVGTGVIGSTTPIGVGFTGTSYSMQSVGNGWYRCIVTGTSTTAIAINPFIYTSDADGTAAPAVGLNGSALYLWGADLRVGSAAGTYQYITSATVYDSNPSNFPPYLDLNGTSSAMATATTIPFAAAQMTVFAGVTKNSDTSFGTVAELSANVGTGNPGSFGLYAPYGGAANFAFNTSNATTGFVASSAASFPFPYTAVLSGQSDFTVANANLRVNGIYVTPSTGAAGGTFGTYSLFIGARSGGTLPMNGRLYGLIVRGAASTATEIYSTEQWLGGKTGLVLDGAMLLESGSYILLESGDHLLME